MNFLISDAGMTLSGAKTSAAWASVGAPGNTD
jgi:hypothetical protein